MKKLDATLVDNLTIEYYGVMKPLTVKKKFNLELPIIGEALSDPLIAYKAATMAAMSMGYKAIIMISPTNCSLKIKMSTISRTALKGSCEFTAPKVKVKYKGTSRLLTDDEMNPPVKLVHGYGVDDKSLEGTKCRTKWLSMMKECYSAKWNEKESSKLTTMCTEWHDLATFAKWYDENNVEGYVLVKALIGDSNNHYCPDSCCYMPFSAFKSGLFVKSSNGLLAGILQRDICKKYHSVLWLGRASQLKSTQKGAQIDFFKHRSMKISKLLEVHHSNLSERTIECLNLLKNEKYNGQ